MSICQNCGKEFEQPSKYRTNKTCSDECRYAMSAKNSTGKLRGRREKRTCPRCGTQFECTVAKPKTYCTWDCMMEARTEESRASRICQVCGKEFTYFKRQDQRTCSPACRNKLTAAQREINYPQCKVCGVSTGSYNRIYCDEHRPSRPGRKPLDRKIATCVGCGEEFSRPGTWPGQMKYCSNKCSHKETKSVRDKFVLELNDKAIVFHSEWEMQFWMICRRHHVSIRRYDGPDIETSEGIYRPDFIIGDGIVVDVKGWLRPESEVKCREAKVLVIGKAWLKGLERCESSEEFWQAIDDMLLEDGLWGSPPVGFYSHP